MNFTPTQWLTFNFHFLFTTQNSYGLPFQDFFKFMNSFEFLKNNEYSSTEIVSKWIFTVQVSLVSRGTTLSDNSEKL